MYKLVVSIYRCKSVKIRINPCGWRLWDTQYLLFGDNKLVDITSVSVKLFLIQQNVIENSDNSLLINTVIQFIF